MLKKIALIIIIIVIFGLQPLSSQWTKSYGGEGLNFEPIIIHAAQDGGYIAGGIYIDYNSAISRWAGWIMKLSVLGNVEWIKQYSPVLGLTPTANGGYAAVGWDTIFRIDASGKLMWHKQVKIERFISIEQTSDGGFITSGHLFKREEGSSYCFIKFSPTGKVKWKRKFAINNFSEDLQSTRIHETADGGYIAVGNTKYHPPFPPAFWIMKIDRKGRISWQKRFGGMVHQLVKDFIITPKGDYILMGDQGYFGHTGLDTYIWAMKIHSNGEIIWQKDYRAAGYEMPESLISTQDGGCLITGWISHMADHAFLALKLSPKGKIQWCRIFGKANGNRITDVRYLANSACQTSKGRYVILGNNEFSEQSVNTINAIRQKDITVLKLNKKGYFYSCPLLQDYPGFTSVKTSYPFIDFRYGLRDFPCWTWDSDLEVKDILIEVDDDICFEEY